MRGVIPTLHVAARRAVKSLPPLLGGVAASTALTLLLSVNS